MRSPFAIAAFAALAAALASPAAWALPTTAKALAAFDVGYVQCEKRFAPMRGHADEAYAGVWKHSLDAKLKAQLAAARASAEYGAEHKRVLGRIGKDESPEAVKKVGQQCQGVWQETGLAPLKLAP